MVKINELYHPEYRAKSQDWAKFRLTFAGGRLFIDTYLKRYSKYELSADFNERKSITYVPAHAKGAVQMVINALFQRLVDVERKNGDPTYQNAVSGRNGGVDRASRTMNSFMGEEVLPELLPLGQVYVFVDAPVIPDGASRADTTNSAPYLYTYHAEEVPSWLKDDNGGYKTLLLRRSVPIIDTTTGLPEGNEVEYRLFRDMNGVVSYTTYDADGNQKGSVVTLSITKIPVVKITLIESLLQDIADYQVSLLQMASCDVNFLTRSNFPLYTEQYDQRYQSWTRGPAHPSSGGSTDDSGTPTSLEQRATRVLEGDITTNAEKDTQRQGGTKKGVGYGRDLDRPGFINPSPDPAKVSMAKQKEMAEEIRNLVDLALSSMAASYASGKSKMTDQLGLEAGLSYIGLVLEQAEREIAGLWAMYSGGEVAEITYPLNYSLRTDEDRRQEAKEYGELADKTTSATYKREVLKMIATSLLSHRSTAEEMKAIYDEIDVAPGTTSDSKQIIEDHKQGLVSNDTASKLRGYPDGEATKAEADHVKRVAAIVEAQSKAKERGADDLDSDRADGKKLPGKGRGEGDGNVDD